MTVDGAALHIQAPTMYESLPKSTSGNMLLHTTSSPRFTACATICALVLLYLVHRSVRYFTFECPSWMCPRYGGNDHGPGSGVKPDRNDVDYMQVWISMRKFSESPGGETHVLVAGADIAQDLLVKNAAVSSARADLGAIHASLKVIGTCCFSATPKRFTVKRGLRAYHDVTQCGQQLLRIR